SFSMDIHEASVPISPAPRCIPRGQLARSLGTFVPIFPKARGLRRQSSSCCTWLSHARTTMPHPTFPVASGFRWGLPYLLSTSLRIQQEISRVPHDACQEHAAHRAEWSAQLSSKGSERTCIRSGLATFLHDAFTAHADLVVDHWASEVERSSPLDILLLPDLETRFVA